MSKVYITGHRNPDLDSVCASFAYAALKNRVDSSNEYIGVRCGHLSDTVKEQVAITGIETVPYLRDVFPKVKDVMMKGSFPFQKDEPIYNLVNAYNEDQPSAIPVFDNDEFYGLLSINDITRWFLKENTDRIPTYNIRMDNIASVLPGRFIQKGKDIENAPIIAGAAALEEFKSFVPQNDNAVVVMGFREEIIKHAMKMQVPAIIITTTEDIHNLDYSEFKGALYMTSLGTAEAIRRLRMAVNVGELIRVNQGMKLSVDTTFEDAKQILMSSRLRGLSVYDNDKWVGFVTRRCFLTKPAYKVILVDHNEVGQSIRGIETAEVQEIIDHHRLDALKTDTPIYIDAEPVGSTCTIVYQQYLKKGLVPDVVSAKTLLVGIISDTLILKSPTTTEIDRQSADALAKICKVDIQSFGEKLFSCTQSLAKSDPEKEISSDFKVYNEGGLTIGIGQCEVTTLSDLSEYSAKYIESLNKMKKDAKLSWTMLMVTDVLKECSILLVSECKQNEKLPYVKLSDGVYDMPGVMSRKKQLLPEVLHTLD